MVSKRYRNEKNEIIHERRMPTKIDIIVEFILHLRVITKVGSNDSVIPPIAIKCNLYGGSWLLLSWVILIKTNIKDDPFFY